VASSPIPILKDTTPQGLLNWALSVAQWAATVQAELVSLGVAPAASVTNVSSTPQDWHFPFRAQVGNANYVLADTDIGVQCFEFTSATQSITLPTPAVGAWFDIQIRVTGASTITILDDGAHTLMSWAPGAGIGHRWVRAEVQDNNGTLQWTLYIARTWTADIPPSL
jgi:hypothetical protein